jgi:hypothetical protein
MTTERVAIREKLTIFQMEGIEGGAGRPPIPQIRISTRTQTGQLAYPYRKVPDDPQSATSIPALRSR